MMVPANLLAELALLAEAEYPLECCGALLGRPSAASPRLSGGASEKGSGPGGEPAGARVVRIVPCGNAAEDRASRYAIAPEELLDLHRAARREGLEVVGYYHSHPSGDGTPSAVDRAESWPDLAYVIIPVRAGEALEPRCWHFGAARPVEEPILDAESERGPVDSAETP